VPFLFEGFKMNIGDEVKIIGPSHWAGFFGTIVGIDGNAVTVEIPMPGEVRNVSFPPDELELRHA
jgi:hypothetical protein